MNDDHSAAARLVPADQLNAISSLIAEGAVFEGSFSSAQDLGLKIDGVLKGGVALIAKPVIDAYRQNWCDDGTTFFGSKGWISLSRGAYAASNPDWFREKPAPDAKRVPYQNNYYEAFVHAVRDHTPSIGPIGDAVRSDALSHLSVLAIQSGGEVVWDPKKYSIVSPEPLNERMSYPVRGDWKQS